MTKKLVTNEHLSSKKPKDYGGFTRDEIAATVCGYFCDGYPPGQIRNFIEERYNVTLSREDPFRLLSYAANRGWLHSTPPTSAPVASRMQNQFKSLKKVVAVQGLSQQIAYHVAKTLLEMVQSFCQENGYSNEDGKSEVHIGFAGGGLLRRSARFFAEMLREPTKNLPKIIVFHALVPGFDITSPHKDPNAFFAYLVSDSPLQIETKFVGFHAPGFMSSTDEEKWRSMDYVKESYALAKHIDIIVTSAGDHWAEGHSALHNMYSNMSKESLNQLSNAGCIGDMMWCPIGSGGPLKVSTAMRATTLIDINELPDFISHGKQILLSLRHCGQCGKPKTDVLKAILNCEKTLITHLVVDSRTAREVLGDLKS